jgi:hypothetical protein
MFWALRRFAEGNERPTNISVSDVDMTGTALDYRLQDATPLQLNCYCLVDQAVCAQKSVRPQETEHIP